MTAQPVEPVVPPHARVLAAASELFLARGYLSTSVVDVARTAGVALQTVYRGFGSKVGLLSAVQDQAVVGDDREVAQLDRGWARALETLPPAEALEVLADEAVSSARRAAPVFAVIAAASADPAVGELLEETHRRRVQTCQELGRRVLGRPSTRFGDLVYLTLGMESYLLLVVRRRWSEQQWRDLAVRTLRSELDPDRPEG